MNKLTHSGSYRMLVDVDDSDDEAPCLIPAGDEVPTLVSGSEDDTPNIPVTIITGQYWLTARCFTGQL